MKRNFKIETAGFALNSGLFIELHSDFMLTNFEYNLLDRRFTMYWSKLNESWAHEYNFDQLQIVFNKLSLLKISPRDPAYPEDEDNYLQSMGFLSPDYINTMDGCLDDKLMRDHGNTEDYHMIFLFYSEAAIKLYAEEVKLIGLKDDKIIFRCDDY